MHTGYSGKVVFISSGLTNRLCIQLEKNTVCYHIGIFSLVLSLIFLIFSQYCFFTNDNMSIVSLISEIMKKKCCISTIVNISEWVHCKDKYQAVALITYLFYFKVLVSLVMLPGQSMFINFRRFNFCIHLAHLHVWIVKLYTFVHL